MRDLYEVLGFTKRTVTQKQIRSAYRRLAKKLHSDRGGSDDLAFSEVAEAHRILSDPLKRAEYDRTGSTEIAEPDNAEAYAMTALVDPFLKTIEHLIGEGRDPAREDVTKIMIESLANALKSGEGELSSLLLRRKYFAATLGRWSGIDGENPFEAAARATIVLLDATIANTERDVDLCRRAIEKVRKIGYRVDKDHDGWNLRRYTGRISPQDKPLLNLGGSWNME